MGDKNILYEHGIVGGGINSSTVRGYKKQIANLTSIADIYDRVPSGAQAVMYDLFDGTNDRSAGLIENYKGIAQSAYSSGTSTFTVDTVTGLAVGEEVTVQDDVNKEVKIVQSFAAGTTGINVGGAKTVTATGATVATSGTFSRTAKTMTAVGNAQIATAQSVIGSSSIFLDGSGDYVTAPDDNDWNLGTFDFTLSAYVKFAALPSTLTAMTIFSQYADTNNYWRTEIYNNAGTYQISFVARSGGTLLINNTQNITLTTNTWYHYEVCRTGTVLKYFLNGIQQGADVPFNFTLPDVASTLSIGRYNSVVGNEYYVNGYLDEMHISRGIARHTSTFTPSVVATIPDPYTVLLLHCEGTNGSTTFTDDNTTYTVPPKFGAGMATIGASAQYLSTPHSTDLSLTTGDWTIEGWLFGQASISKILVHKGSNGSAGTYSFILFIDSGNLLDFQLYDGVEKSVNIARASVLTTGWNHVAVVRSGNTVTMYVNGVSVGTPLTGVGTLSDNAAWPLSIGGASYASIYSINSYLDEFRISKGIARYTANFTPPSLPSTTDTYTKLLLHMDGTNGSTSFPDSSEQVGTGTTVTFTAATTNSYKNKAVVYRSLYNISNYKLKMGDWASLRAFGGKTVTAVGDAKIATTTPLRLATKTVTPVNVTTITSGAVRGAKTLTPHGNAQVSTSQFKLGTGSALLDGTGDYISTPDHTDFDFGSSDFTIRCFIYPVAKGSMIVTHGGAGYASANQIGWYFQIDVNSLTFAKIDTYNGSPVSSTFSYTVPLSQWTHLEVVRTGNTLKLFVDGTQQGGDKAFTGSIVDSTQILSIGSDMDGNGGFNGYIDELEISKGIARHTTNFTPPTTALTSDQYTVLLMHSDGTNGSTTFADDVTGGTIGPKFGTAMATFDGTGDYLSVPDSTDFAFTNGNFTMEGWVWLGSLPSTSVDMMVFTQKTAYNSNNQISVYISNLAGVMNMRTIFTYDGVTGISHNTPIPSINANTWYHIASVRNGTSVLNFFNGILLGTYNIGTNSLFDSTATFKIGGLSDGAFVADFFGYMDDVHISKGIARYTADFTVPTSPASADAYTVLLLHMDGTNGGTTFTDDAGSLTPKFGTGMLVLDGNGDYLTIPDSADFSFGSADWTIEGWFNFASFASFADPSLFGQFVDLNNRFHIGYHSGSSQIYVIAYSGGTAILDGTASATLALNVWYHIAVQSRSGAIEVYLNGTKLTNSGDMTSGTLLDVAAPVEIGRLNYSSNYGYVYGRMDDLRVSKGIARYTSNFTAPLSQLTPDDYTVLLLHMDGTNGSVLFSDDLGTAIPLLSTDIRYSVTPPLGTAKELAVWVEHETDTTAASYTVNIVEN